MVGCPTRLRGQYHNWDLDRSSSKPRRKTKEGRTKTGVEQKLIYCPNNGKENRTWNGNWADIGITQLHNGTREATIIDSIVVLSV